MLQIPQPAPDVSERESARVEWGEVHGRALDHEGWRSFKVLKGLWAMLLDGLRICDMKLFLVIIPFSNLMTRKAYNGNLMETEVSYMHRAGLITWALTHKIRCESSLLQCERASVCLAESLGDQ